MPTRYNSTAEQHAKRSKRRSSDHMPHFWLRVLPRWAYPQPHVSPLGRWQTPSTVRRGFVIGIEFFRKIFIPAISVAPKWRNKTQCICSMHASHSRSADLECSMSAEARAEENHWCSHDDCDACDDGQNCEEQLVQCPTQIIFHYQQLVKAWWVVLFVVHGLRNARMSIIAAMG